MEHYAQDNYEQGVILEKQVLGSLKFHKRQALKMEANKENANKKAGVIMLNPQLLELSIEMLDDSVLNFINCYRERNERLEHLLKNRDALIKELLQEKDFYSKIHVEKNLSILDFMPNHKILTNALKKVIDFNFCKKGGAGTILAKIYNYCKENCILFFNSNYKTIDNFNPHEIIYLYAKDILIENFNKDMRKILNEIIVIKVENDPKNLKYLQAFFDFSNDFYPNGTETASQYVERVFLKLDEIAVFVENVKEWAKTADKGDKNFYAPILSEIFALFGEKETFDKIFVRDEFADLLNSLKPPIMKIQKPSIKTALPPEQAPAIVENAKAEFVNAEPKDTLF